VKTLTVKVPNSLDARLSALARRRGLERAVIVRDALIRYLSNPDTEGSFLDLARDHAGCVSGPPDLSVSKNDLEGYGR
jgi:hypothetical protein